MQTHNFPCPFCGRKMGVGTDLLGRKVRCPHCKQVVLAPSSAPAAQAPAAPPPPPPVAVVPPPPPQPAPQVPAPADADLPVFNIQPAEAPDSIFGEQRAETDDLFGSDEPVRPIMPEMPPPEPAVVPVVPVPTPAAVQPVPVIHPTQPAAAEPADPFADLARPEPPPAAPQPPPLPPRVQAVPLAPAPAPVPVPVPAPMPVVEADPFAGFETAATVPPVRVPQPVPVPVPVPAPVAYPDDEPVPIEEAEAEAAPPKPRADRERDRDRGKQRPRAAAPAGGGAGLKVGFFVLLAYAVAVTGLAAYGLFFKSGAPSGHPLSTLPDDYGEFKPAERKKTGRIAFPEGPVPPELRVALGEKLTIGSLEVQPTRVEKRRLTLVQEFSDPKRPKSEMRTSTDAVVLHLTIRNTSDDLLIHPTDPAFNRKVPPGTREPVGSGLVAGKQTYWGGAVRWPFDARLARQYEAGQEKDATPLQPGESREYEVFTDARQDVVRAAESATDPLLWRVQLRRGRIEFDGKDVPVTAVIGVEFKASDIQG